MDKSEVDRVIEEFNKYQNNALKNYIFFNLKYILFYALIFGGVSYLIRIIPWWDLGLVLLGLAIFFAFRLRYLMVGENKERIKNLKQAYRDEGLEEKYLEKIQFGD